MSHAMDRFDTVVLVGHGAPATDTPREWVTRLKALEVRRRASGSPPTEEERDLDARVRAWPRTAATDPYRAGVQALAERLRAALPGVGVVVAFNEFCAPSLEDAVLTAARQGARSLSVVPTMLTPGGVHSEQELPETLRDLRARLPEVEITYAWPFDLDAVASLLAAQVLRDTSG